MDASSLTEPPGPAEEEAHDEMRKTGTSLWFRRSLRPSSTTPSPTAPPPPAKDQPVDQREPEPDASVSLTRMASAHSIVPDAVDNAHDVAWPSVPLPSFSTRYHIHNPVGPRYYRNIHLIPPSHIRPGARPPSVFSPSFPPISTHSVQDHVDAGPGATSSHSNLPTPSSSQTRVADGTKPRSRKTSQTTPDNVDLMDVTDPWGTNWHHTSPYDIGIPSSSADNYDSPTRKRRASMTATQSGHKTVSPSPLSQSTSAVHLQSELGPIHMPRKLSKRQKPAIGNIFGGKDKEPEPSAQPSPVEHVPAIHALEPNPTLPKRMSVAPPLEAGGPLYSRPSLKKEKRGSVLGRLARKLSVMRRSFDGYGKSHNKEDDWHYVSAGEAAANGHTLEPVNLDNTQENQERLSAKRVPPPAMDDPPIAPAQQDPPPHEGDSASSISVHAPFSMGKLTIANPDVFVPETPTPNVHMAPLPPDKPQPLVQSPAPVSPDGILSTPLSPSPKTDIPKAQVPSPSPSPAPPTPAKEDLLPHASASAQQRISLSTQRPPSSFQSVEPSQSPAPGTPATIAHTITDNQTTPRPMERNISLQPDPPPKRASSRYSSQTIQQTAPRPASGATATSSYVPFPSPLADVLLPPSRPQSYLSYADSPLSGVSILANPPTPYTGGLSVPATPEPPPPIPIPSKTKHSPTSTTPLPPVPPPSQATPESSKRVAASPVNRVDSASPQPPQPVRQSTSGSGRQTETFMLVRSSSGHVYASGETIKAAGEQWEVVETGGAGGSGGQERGKTQQLSGRSKKEREARRENREREKGKERERERERGGEREKEERDREREKERERERRRSQRMSSKAVSPEPAVNGRAQVNGHYREPAGSWQDEYLKKEREDQVRKDKEEQARREEHHRRAREEQARKEREEHLKREEYLRREREEQNKREREKERHRRDREEREREREREREKEREERKKEERRSIRNKEERKERRSKDEHRSRGEHRSSEDQRIQEERRKSREEHKPKESSRRREREKDKEKERERERRESRAERKATHAFPTVDMNKPQPPPPPTSSSGTDTPPAQLERQASTSARPTSELPSAADLNALRAKEVWEMERLWKARSMYGAEDNAAPTANSIVGSSTSIPFDAQATMTGNIGSGHTAYVVQNSFHHPPQPFGFYHPSVSAFCPSPPMIPSLHESITSYDIPTSPANGVGPYGYGKYYTVSNPVPPGSGGGDAGPGVGRREPHYRQKELPPLINPLPEPPRESTYEPASLPLPSEYWSKYTGLTTAH